MTTETQKHVFCVAAIAKKQGLERDYLELGGMLYRVKAERLYEAGWSSWEEYEMEFKMDSSKISRLIRIYEVLVLQYRISAPKLVSAGGWTVLGDLLPVIKPETPKERVLELLDLAAGQSRPHLQQTLKEIKRGKPCGHKHTHEVVIEYCDDCGARLEAHSVHGEKD